MRLERALASCDACTAHYIFSMPEPALVLTAGGARVALCRRHEDVLFVSTAFHEHGPLQRCQSCDVRESCLEMKLESGGKARVVLCVRCRDQLVTDLMRGRAPVALGDAREWDATYQPPGWHKYSEQALQRQQARRR